MKIPAHEWQHSLQWNLSQIHSYHGLKRPKKQRNSNLWKAWFSHQLLWTGCYWDGQGISCTFCAIAIQQHTLWHARFTCSYRELCDMWHFMWNTLLEKLLWICTFQAGQLEICIFCTEILHVYRAREPHVNPDSYTFQTQFLTKNDQNSTWKSLHMSDNIVQWRIQDFPDGGAPTPERGCQHTIWPIFPKNCMKMKKIWPRGGGTRPCAPPRSANVVYSKICHKYIHIMGWKDRQSKEIATRVNLVSLSSCCE